MVEHDSPAVLVARFLRTNNYQETLAAFLSEAGLPVDAGHDVGSSLTIETILQEKKEYDVSQSFEKISVHDDCKHWSLPAPTFASVIETLPAASNILHVAVADVVNTTLSSDDRVSLLLATAADKSVNLLSVVPPFAPNIMLRTPVSDSPILSCCIVREKYLITTAMSGKVALYDLRNGHTMDERRDHQKYVVKADYCTDEHGIWIATAAWDAKVLLYRMHLTGDDDQDMKLGNPVAVLELSTNPESMLFIRHPEIASPVLLVSRRDSTFLYYYAVTNVTGSTPSDNGQRLLTLIGKQNLAPHSNAWIAFTPSALALSPKDSSLLAVATSTVPHMKIIIVRLLMPPPQDSQASLFKGVGTITPSASITTEPTQASQARAALALADRESAAILIHCSTLAPQTRYSTPSLAWRPDGSGVWVNGDDGVVRGIETSTGKIVASLKDGHAPGTKIRCLWAGPVNVGGQLQEWLVSGGFDRRLIVWRVQASD